MLADLTLIRAKNLWKPGTYLLRRSHLALWRWRIKEMLHTRRRKLQTPAYLNVQQNVKKSLKYLNACFDFQ